MIKGTILAVLRVRTYELMHPEDMRKNRKLVFEALGYDCGKNKNDKATPLFSGLTVKVEVMQPIREPGSDHPLDKNEPLVAKVIRTQDSQPLVLQLGDWEEIEIVL